MVKKILKILGVLLLLVALVLIWALKTVDYTPYFDDDYYRETRKSTDSLVHAAALQYGPVEIGFGRASITPSVGHLAPDPLRGAFASVPLAGYGNRKGAPLTGVHDSVFVKSVALKVQDMTVFFISADLLIMPPGVTARVTDTLKHTLGIDRRQLFMSATHTHSSIGAWSEGLVGEAFGGEYNPAVVNFLVDRIFAAVEGSMRDLRPGEVGTGSYRAPDYVRNRLVGELGTVDDDFIFLILQQKNGRKAVLGSFAGHATTLGANNMEVSGDYPGYWQRRVEEMGADMAIFYAGSVGSHSVRGGSGEGFARSRSIGFALADSVLKHGADVELKNTIGLSYMTVDMQLPDLHVRITDGLRFNEWIAQRLFPPIGTPTIQAARIGDLIWATTPCDFSGESAVLLKNMVARSGFKGLVTSFNGAYVGYIIPCRYYHLNEYESRIMSWFGPYMGPYTQEILRRMMERLASLKAPDEVAGEKEAVKETVAG
jgi:hypothetical protein